MPYHSLRVGGGHVLVDLVEFVDIEETCPSRHRIARPSDVPKTFMVPDVAKCP